MAQSAPATSPDTALAAELANALRFLAIDAVNRANSGHQGMPMGMADIATVLFTEFMHFNPQDTAWPGRDRFVLSNGHGSMLQYGLLHLLGYDVSLEDLKNFRQLGSKTPGHPEYGHTPGVETTTGPLGQGLAAAVGMALAQKHHAAQYGQDFFQHKIYVTVGDGCLMEGVSHEAAELAGSLQLNNLILLFDSNGISIDGPTAMTCRTDHQARFKAYGFATRTCDGHDHAAIREALSWAQDQQQPVLIEFKTHIGYGSPTFQDTAKVHGNPLSGDAAADVRKALNWPYPPFEIPAHIRAGWQAAAQHGQRTYAEWQKRWADVPAESRQKWQTAQQNLLPAAAAEALQQLCADAISKRPSVATRKASGNCIDVLAPHMPWLIGGSADLTGSNNTLPANGKTLAAPDYTGNYIHYGVREHGMAALMNGLSLYGGIRPVGGTFLAFLDYLRPALRLSALMKQPVVYVLTHDSIGLGEDGPTHQPVEHLAMLRATPDILVFRPADQIETAEAWALALSQNSQPVALSLSRQNLPTIRHSAGQNMVAKGGYILSQEEGELDGIFIATGSEVHLALEAQQTLRQQGIETRVVSMPCLSLFEQQPESYREQVLPSAASSRVVLEAASSFGWHRYAPDGALLCVDTFGASAPAEEVYQKFGITAENAAKTMAGLVE